MGIRSLSVDIKTPLDLKYIYSDVDIQWKSVIRKKTKQKRYQIGCSSSLHIAARHMELERLETTSVEYDSI